METSTITGLQDSGLVQKSQEWVVAPESRDEKLARLREPVLARFEKKGLITRAEDENGSYYILSNLDDFKIGAEVKTKVYGKDAVRTMDQILDNAGHEIERDSELGARRKDRTLYFLFKNLRVITKSDLDLARQQGETPIPKELFYVPGDSNSAMDMEKIKAAEGSFYLLFSDVSSDWVKSYYPTKDKDFASGLTMFEGAVPSMVYGIGNARREANGDLTVLKNLDPLGERQKISGAWFNKNFNFYGIGYHSWSSPAEMVNFYGGTVTESGLLKGSDFSNRNSRNFEIGNDGTFYEEGNKYYLGKALIGHQIVQIGDGKYAVVGKENNEPALIFETKVKEGAERMTRAISLGRKGKSLLYLPIGSYPRFEKENIPATELTIYNDEGRKKLELKGLGSIATLVSCKREYEEKFGPTDDIDSLTSEQQMALAQALNTNSDEKEKMWNFVGNFGHSGMRLVAEGYFQGGFDSKYLTLLDIPHDEAQAVLDSYCALQDTIDRLEESLTDLNTEGARPGDRSTFTVFGARTIEGLRLRSGDLLSVGLSGDRPVLIEHTTLLRNAISFLSDVLKPETEFAEPGVMEFIDQASGKTLRVSEKFTGFEGRLGESLTVTIRPRFSPDSGKKGGGQARIQFSYKGSEGSSFNMRIDLDEYGTSLDLGIRGQPIVDLLEKNGVSHHTQFVFERQFSNPDTFARMAKIFAGAMGINKFN